MNELEALDMLPDPVTGELLPAVPVNAARVHAAAAEQINQLRGLQRECTRLLAEEAQRQGTKTLHFPGRVKATLTGGWTAEFDPHELMAGLMEAGCPSDRVNAAVTETVEYKVNRSVLKQLAGANPHYADVIEHASKEVEKPWRATIGTS